MITRSRLAGLTVAAGWLLVSLLPWWQQEVAFFDQSDTGTRIFSADVWRASTPAALAVVVAASVSVVLVATRAHLPLTQRQRGTGLILACLPVFLLGWAACSIDRLTTAPQEYGSFTMTFIDEAPADDYHVMHDGLQMVTVPGYAEGPAWGLYAGVTLVLAVTACAAASFGRNTPVR